MKRTELKEDSASQTTIVQVFSVEDMLFTLLKVSGVMLLLFIIMLLQILGGPH